MMQNRPGQGQNMPGYTGYQSAQIREEREATALTETTRRQQEENARHQNRVPGYQGYVPSIKSENVFGDTFGSTTRQQKEGKIKAGFDCDNGERYRSVAQGVYTDQMQQHVFGTANRPVGAQATGAVTMDFEQAKRIATEKRQQQFEVNKQRFYGQDFDAGQYKNSTNNFWGC